MVGTAKEQAEAQGIGHFVIPRRRLRGASLTETQHSPLVEFLYFSHKMGQSNSD